MSTVRLRNINPSPYLFFFDYGDYKLMGSSPESQLILQNGEAIVHPIAGTFKRSGDDVTDRQMADKLLKGCQGECRACDAGRPGPQ
jgi:anthranilate synthase component 1